MVNDRRRHFDGFSSLLGGVNGAIAPDLIGSDECADAENVSFRGGHPSTRPGLPTRIVRWFDGDSQDRWETGRFQGAAFWRRPGGQSCLVAVAGGRVFTFTPDGNKPDFVALELPIPGGRLGVGLNADSDFYGLCQAANCFIVQDGVYPALVLSEDGSWRSDQEDGPIPIGRIMTYGQGRLWVANGPEYVAGDLIGTGRNSIVNFTETTYLNEGGAFRLPEEFGDVRAMIFLPQSDTATGQGSLYVLGENGIESVRADVERSLWKDTVIQVQALREAGCTGPRALCVAGEDLWFRSADGWRSYRQARAEASGYRQVPRSARVRRYVEAEWLPQARYSGAMFFDNRLIFTTCPRVNQTEGWGHDGLLVLDFDVISAGGILNLSSPGAWEGLWTRPDVRFLQLVSADLGARRRGLIFARVQGVNSIVEVDSSVDNDDGDPISCRLETRRYSFPSASGGGLAPFEEKKLIGGDLSLRDRLGAVDVTVDYRQDGSPLYKAWHHFGATSPSSVSFVDGAVVEAPPLYTVREEFPRPPISTDPITRRMDDRCRSVQARVTWTGSLALDQLRLHAIVQSEDAGGGGAPSSS